ncbi:MAG: hypothetical protein MJ033_04255 [Victivallaceae bacterium]|nr:hypothetical protein [Victivallaceae bacterium]
MNIQPGRSLGTTRKTKQKQSVSFGGHMLSLGKWVIVVGALAFVFIAQTNFRQRINDISGKIREEKSACKRLRHAIEYNDIRIAQLTDWSHISAKISRHRLNLAPIRGPVYQLSQRDPAENDVRFSAWLKNRRQMSAMTAKSR